MTQKSWKERVEKYPNIMFGRALRSARHRASKRGMGFDIDKEYIMALFDDQKGKCYYSGITMNIAKANDNTFHDPLKMSLDCVDHEKGYVKGNVVWCAYCVNALKLKMSTEEMVGVCKGIVKVAKKKGW
tara:strand:- start:2738 stop:3124 length:387 start_codon:yes stop_codon:yes gene_type:complete